MDVDEIVAQLGQLGLSSYEAKAYVALTRRDSATASEAARLAGVPRQRIYDVLASLVEKGLAVTRPGRVIKYSATAPTIALEGLLARRRAELAAFERAAKEMVRELKPAYDEGQTQTDPLEYIEVLRDRRAINERFHELEEGIKDEILVFTKPPYATTAQENVEGLEVVKSHKGYSVYEYSAFDDPAFAAAVRGFVDAGEEARFVPELPLKLVIIDEAIVMFGMEDPVAGRVELTMCVIEHASLAKTLKTAFMAYWNEGLSFDEASEQLTVAAAQSA